MDELVLAIQAAGNDPEELRQVALRFNLDPAFVASVAAGTSRTTMGQSFSLPLLLSSGIIPPEQLSLGFAQAEESALREAMQDWDEAYAELIPDAPTFNRFEEAKYADNPVAAEFFQAIRLGTPLARVVSGDAYQEFTTSMLENEQKDEHDEFVADLGTFDEAFKKHQQELYEYEMSGNSPKLQAAMLALGERPSAATFDTSSARFDYAKALGLPALALLPDPMESATVPTEELLDAAGGVRGKQAFQSMLDMIDTYQERGERPVARGSGVRGYGAIGREPEGVAPLSSIPLSARGGSGMDVYDRIASIPESQRVQGLQGVAATAGRKPQAPRGMSEREIRQLDLDIAAEKRAAIEAGLTRLQQQMASRKPNPFQEALSQYSLFGALEANV